MRMKLDMNLVWRKRMIHFLDQNGNKVSFSFEKHPFQQSPKHVFVICRYNQAWLLTNHSERGYEFPGGKVEDGETIEESAIREVYEETGGIVENLHYIGQYKVDDGKSSFVKAVFYAEIKEISQKDNYLETFGPVLIDSSLSKNDLDHTYSFIMKDEMLQLCLSYIRNQIWK